MLNNYFNKNFVHFSRLQETLFNVRDVCNICLSMVMQREFLEREREFFREKNSVMIDLYLLNILKLNPLLHSVNIYRTVILNIRLNARIPR